MKTNIMTKMTARDITKNILQYISMIIINVLAVTLFCGFLSNALTLEKHLDKYYEDTNLTDIICQYSSFSNDDRAFLKELNQSLDEENKLTWEYRFYANGSINQKSAKIYVDFPNNQISQPQIIDGARGVLVDRHAAEIYSFNIGTKIELELDQIGLVKVVITGIMNFAETANTYTYCPVFLDYSTFIESFSGSNQIEVSNIPLQILIKTNSPQIIKDEINSYYENKEGSNLLFLFDRDSMESVVMLNNEISQSLKMIYVFPVIFLLVSVLVILSTIGPLILRERTNIGTLKGLGISNKKLILHYSLFGAVLCFIGGIIGVVAGPLIIPNIMLLKYSMVYSIPEFSGIVFSPLWSIIAVLGVSILAALIGLFVCHKTIREKPAACMRPLPPKENALLRRTGKSINKRFENIPLKMAIRNIIVKPVRAVMTVVGVTGCVALLVCSFGIGDTINNSVDSELGGQFYYDITGTYTKEIEEDFLEKMNVLADNGRIDYYETFKTYFMSAKGKNLKDIKVFIYPENSRFTTIKPNGKTLMSKAIAEDLGIRKGDSVLLSSVGKTYNFIVDDIIETAYTKGVFLDDSDSALFEGSYFANSINIKSRNPDDSLVNYINEINGAGLVASASNMRETVNNLLSSISLIKLTLMIFAILLSVVVLYNLSLLNIKERSRDIATLKVLGFTRRQIGRSILYEIMFLVFFGTIFGLLLGYPLTVLVLSINRIEVLTFLYHVKPISYLISAAISLVTGFLINFLFSHQIKEIDMIESLKSVE